MRLKQALKQESHKLGNSVVKQKCANVEVSLRLEKNARWLAHRLIIQ